MSDLPGLSPLITRVARQGIIRFERDRKLHAILAAAGVTIDDVVNSPIAKRKAIVFHRTSLTVRRLTERYDLEQQWNPLGLSSPRPTR